jgi:hypothetical protein
MVSVLISFSSPESEKDLGFDARKQVARGFGGVVILSLLHLRRSSFCSKIDSIFDVAEEFMSNHLQYVHVDIETKTLDIVDERASSIWRQLGEEISGLMEVTFQRIFLSQGDA